MRRLDSIDILRALCIVGMFLCHFVIYTSRPGEGDFPEINFIADQIIGNWPAALFLFLSGASFALSTQRQLAAGKSPTEVRNRGLRRGAILFLVGLAFEAGVWSPSDVFDWDVLTTIATALLLLPLLHRAPAWVFVTTAAALCLAGPVLFSAWDGASMWEQADDFQPTAFTPRYILVGYLVAGYFPVIPWVGYALVGYAVGRRFLCGETHEGQRAHLAFAGAALMSLGLGLALINAVFQPAAGLETFVSKFNFYPLSPSLFLFNMGLALSTFALLHAAIDQRPAERPFLGFFRVVSRYSLTLYVVHHILLVVPQRIAGVVLEGDQFAFVYSQEVIPPPISLGLAVLAVPVFFWLCRLWDRAKGRFSLEWFLARLAG
jgi:uncharacterized membrane protein